jgi:L-malate glycosyltransferase
MRILHVNNEKTWRGGERQTLLTAAEQRRQGLDSCIACRSGSPLSEAAAADRVPTVNLPAAAPAALARLMQAAKRFDLLHCHTGRAHSLAALATLGRRKPLVVSRRVDFSPGNSWFNRWKYRRTAMIVCVSKWIYTVMQDWGLPPEQMRVIYEAVPGDAYLPREASLQQLRERTGVPPGQRIVGNIAALVGHKDHATLLRAAKVVSSSRHDVAFIIVGEGELRRYLRQLRSDLGLTDIVHFTGFIPQAQRLLPGFDVFAMSSSMEGLGTIVLDAGLAGVPVAATAGGGLPEAVLHNQTGLLVPVGDAAALADAIMRLLNDASLAARLADAARARIRSDFSVPFMARSYTEIYQEVLAGADRSERQRL